MNGNPQQDVAARWDGIAQTYQQQRYWGGPENHANLHWLLHEIGDPRGKSVIEVGSGSGFTSLELARRGAAAALLDISPRSVELARSYFMAEGLPAPTCFLEDALRSSVPSESFDVVWNGGVIEHFADADKERLLHEMLRMVKPGGVVVVMVPNAWCWQFQIKQRMLKLRGKWAYGFEDDMSPRRLRRMCERVGVRADVYAFNPVLGWWWFSKLRPLIRLLRLNTPEHHRRRSWMGFVTVAAIRKGEDPLSRS